MKILVTGGDGFVASRLIPQLVADGHEVVAGLRPAAVRPADEARRAQLGEHRTVALELLDSGSVRAVVEEGWDAVVHLAAVASGTDAQRDPMAAWEVNAVGSARLASELGRLRRAGDDPVLLLASTAEVYGKGTDEPRVELDSVHPCSPYAASKLAAEVAVLEVRQRTGLRVVIARAFPHTGAGQDTRFVVPAFAERILVAKRVGAPVVKVGNLDPVREFLHVSDVARAYGMLLGAGRSGEVYNVASGRAISVRELFFLVADAAGHRAIPEVDIDLMRSVDIPYLVGDSAKLHRETRWQPQVSLEALIEEVVNAQAG